MNKLVANIFVLVLIIELILLSMQAEVVTATIGYVIAALLSVALLLSIVKNNVRES
jgi:hypothetical protein